MVPSIRSLVLVCGLIGTSAQAANLVEGPFVGVLPCADCPGTRTELALERDTKGAPRRYWLREIALDAKAGKRKQEFTARAEPKAEPSAAESKTDAAPAPTFPPAPAPRPADAAPDGTGSIEATLDARSTESMGQWREEPASASRGARVVIETVNGPRYFVRVSDRVLEAQGSGGATATSKGEQRLQLRAGGATPFGAPAGTHVAGMVSRDARGRLVLAPCATERGAYVLTDGAGVIGVGMALEALDFARHGRAFLEVYGVNQGASLRVTRVARASTDMDCTSAAPAPVTLAATGGDGVWSLRADVDGIRLALPSANKTPTERGSTAQPLAWSWRDGRAEAASAVLRSGDVTVRATPRLCRDTMSNTVYGFAAELTWGARKFSGCAWSAAPEQP